MKKLIALLLSTLFVLSVFSGCGPAASSGETTAPANVQHTLSVGFGRADITPKESVPLSGGFTALDRMSDGVNEPIYSTCIAFTDETDNTFLLIISDMLYVYVAMAQARADISKKTGIPATQIWIATTHNHAGPAAGEDIACIETYNVLLREQICKAAEDALADRKPAKMYITDTHPEGMNFVRHYLLSDGSYGGDNFGNFKDNTIVGHATEVDNQMQLLKFVREGGKDIVMMNWQGHPTGHSGADRYRILSCVTVATNKIEAELDCHFAYVLGASGNVNSSSRIKGEQRFTGYKNIYEGLAQFAIDAAPNFKEVDIGKVQVLNEKCACAIKNSNSTMDLSLNAFAIGDVAFVAVPYEMFCENGMHVKDNSPFEMTFVSTCTNGYASYIPSQFTYEYGGYEANGTNLAMGGAEKLADTFVSMLKTLHETN